MIFAKTDGPILLAVLEYGELPELLRVAETAAIALQREVIFLFVKRSYRRLAEDTTTVVDSGFKWMGVDGQVHDKPASTESLASEQVFGDIYPTTQQQLIPKNTRGRNFASRLLAMLLLPVVACAFLVRTIGKFFRLLARDIANFTRDVRRFRIRYRELAAVLTRMRPSLLIVGQDSIGGELSFILIAAGRLGIPRLISPFAMFPIQGAAEFALSRSEHHADSTAMNWVVSKIFPQWVLNFRGVNLLRLPGYRALALEMTKLVKGLPWSSLTEPVEAITANSIVAADSLAALGVNRSFLHIIGSPMQDRLAMHCASRALVREAVCEESGLDPEKPLIVCGWPVNMFAWLGGRTIGYRDYASLTSAWARILVEVRDQYGVNIILSIHPKTLPSEYVVAENLGLPCRRNGTDELVAVCDLFTTLNGSSVTAWAIACGLPVLIFDCFLTRYPEFLNVPGCLCVETEEEFSRALHDLCSNEAHRTALAARQQGDAAHWGRLDGQAGARLADLLRDLTAGTKR